MENQPKELREYETPQGKVPFKEWLLALRDVRAVAKIIVRLQRVAFGNYGDCRSVGDGVFEIRIHFGPGYRVYFGEDGMKIIILLWGGDKGSQSKDIAKAKRYWEDYQGHL